LPLCFYYGEDTRTQSKNLSHIGNKSALMKRLNEALNLESEETKITEVHHDIPMQPLFTMTPLLQQKAMLFGNYCHHYSSSLSNNQLIYYFQLA